MSVHKLRSSFDNKGCQVVLWVIMVGSALALAGTGFFACFNPALNDTSDPNAKVEMFKVNGMSVSALDVSNQQEYLAQSFANNPQPDAEFWHLSASLDGLVTDRVISTLTIERGVKVTEAQALSLAGQAVDDEILQERVRAVTRGDIAQDATESEWQEYFKENYGVGTSEFKQQRIKIIEDALNDDSRKEAVLLSYSNQALRNSYLLETEITDEELEKSFEKYEVLTMMFLDQDLALDEREAKAKEALAELQAGADFIEVMNKYVDSPNTTPATYDRVTIEANESLMPITELKEGEHTDVVYLFVGIPTIVKLVSINKELPEDFEDNKEFHKQQPRQVKASQAYETAIAEARKRAQIEWMSPGYKTIYELTVALRDTEMKDEPLKAYLREVIDTSFPTADDLGGSRPAIYSRYVAMRSLDNLSTIEERKEIAPSYAQILLELLKITESVQARLELVEVYERMDDMEAATNMLKDATMMNTGFATENETYNDEINRTLFRYQSESKISEPLFDEISQLIKQWGMDKATADHELEAGKSNLDKFNIDPVTGKLIGEAGEEGAEGSESTEGEDDTTESESGDGEDE